MGLICSNYAKADGTIFENAYIRINKVRSDMVDYEFFEDVDEPENPEIAQRLRYRVRCESVATAYVYGDQKARENRVQPTDWFSFMFDFDHECDKNIYEQAYDALQRLDRFKEVNLESV